jgi:hypothetical protein
MLQVVMTQAVHLAIRVPTSHTASLGERAEIHSVD